MTGLCHASEPAHGQSPVELSHQHYPRLLAVLIALGQFRVLEEDEALDDRASRIARLVSGDCRRDAQRDVRLEGCAELRIDPASLQRLDQWKRPNAGGRARAREARHRHDKVSLNDTADARCSQPHYTSCIRGISQILILFSLRPQTTKSQWPEPNWSQRSASLSCPYPRRPTPLKPPQPYQRMLHQRSVLPLA